MEQRLTGRRLSALACLWALTACSGAPRLEPTPGAFGFDNALSAWRAGSTGGRGPDATWAQRADPGAISPPNVLAVTEIDHDSEDRFNVFWRDLPAFQDGRLSLAVRADAGVVDQGGGPMWRVQDADNYYVCRFNPLEANYRVYVVRDGVRRQLATALADVRVGQWHRIEVAHEGDHIVCWLDGLKLLDVHDDTILVTGGVGLWTKADARTSFDDFAVTPALR